MNYTLSKVDLIKQLKVEYIQTIQI